MCAVMRGSSVLHSCLDGAAKNEWTLVASMSVRRSSVGVAAMGGFLYALGGYDGVTRHCLSSVEAYDKDNDKVRPADRMPCVCVCVCA